MKIKNHVNKHFHRFCLVSIAIIITSLCSNCIFANNIRISNIKDVEWIENNSPAGQKAASAISLSFDIEWDNSYRTGGPNDFYDAVWIFAKHDDRGYDTSDSYHPYYPVYFDGNNFSAPDGVSVSMGLRYPGKPADVWNNRALGAFIFRSTPGYGHFSAKGVKLRRLFDSHLVAIGGGQPADIDSIKLYAIEMVYIPGGSYRLGSGGTECNSFTDGSWKAGNSIPFTVKSEDAITIDPSPGHLWTNSATPSSSIGQSGILPDSFPKGYAPFYCMKHEITQGQYADFLTSLVHHDYGGAGWNKMHYYRESFENKEYRNGLLKVLEHKRDEDSIFNYTSTNPDVAYTNLSWLDLTAYAQWAGLRPVTELEFEKVCRGPAAPVPNEYAWGSTYIKKNEGLIYSGQSNEVSANNGNCTYNNQVGPMRVGANANDTTRRVSSGGSYYGVMEMSGNANEYVVTIADSTGRTFCARDYGDGSIFNYKGKTLYVINGDGKIYPDGVAFDWINPVQIFNDNIRDGIGFKWFKGYSNDDTVMKGVGTRGGGYQHPASYLMVSDRSNALVTNNSHSLGCGGRLVRDAPKNP